MEILEIFDALYSSDEYSEAKKSLIYEKVLGSDGFAPEFLKYCDFDNMLLGYVNKLWLARKHHPDQWSKSDMEPLLKPGDLSLIDNYRY